MTPNHQQAVDAAEKIAHWLEHDSGALMPIVVGETKYDYGVRLLKAVAGEVRRKFVSPPAASPEQAAPDHTWTQREADFFAERNAAWDQLRTALAESQRLRQELAKDDDIQAEMAKRIAELEKDVDLAKRERNMYDSAQKREAVNVLNLSARLRAVSEALEQEESVTRECDYYLRDEVHTFFAKLRAIVEGR